MKKLWSGIHVGAGKLSDVFAVLCAVAGLINMVILTIDVVMRTVFSKPIAGITEYATIILMYVAYFGVAYTLIKGRHMQMGAFYEKLPPKGMAAMDCLINLVIIFVFVILTIASMEGLERSIATMETMQASVTVYRWPGRLAIVLACILVAIQGVIRFADSVIRVVKPVGAEQEGG